MGTLCGADGAGWGVGGFRVGRGPSVGPGGGGGALWGLRGRGAGGVRIPIWGRMVPYGAVGVPTGPYKGLIVPYRAVEVCMVPYGAVGVFMVAMGVSLSPMEASLSPMGL